MIINILPNNYSKLDLSNQYELSFNDLIDSIFNDPNYIHSDSKDSSSMLIPYNYDIVPKERFDTAINVYLICLDIEHSKTISQVENSLKNSNLSFILYTTWSHSNNDHRFRVLLPLKNPIKFSTFYSEIMKNSLKRIFPFNDCNTVKACGFYLPSNNSPDYYYSYNIANDFAFEDFPKFKQIILEEKRKFENKPKDNFKETTLYKVVKSQRISQFATKYLMTNYNKTKGNGDSNLSLFKALLASKNNPLVTQDIINKAKREGWSDKEIQYKLNKIANIK